MQVGMQPTSVDELEPCLQYLPSTAAASQGTRTTQGSEMPGTWRCQAIEMPGSSTTRVTSIALLYSANGDTGADSPPRHRGCTDSPPRHRVLTHRHVTGAEVVHGRVLYQRPRGHGTSTQPLMDPSYPFVFEECTPFPVQFLDHSYPFVSGAVGFLVPLSDAFFVSQERTQVRFLAPRSRKASALHLHLSPFRSFTPLTSKLAQSSLCTALPCNELDCNVLYKRVGIHWMHCAALHCSALRTAAREGAQSREGWEGTKEQGNGQTMGEGEGHGGKCCCGWPS